MHMGQNLAISIFVLQPMPSDCSPGAQLTVFYFEVVMKSVHEIQHQEASQPYKPDQEKPGRVVVCPQFIHSLYPWVLARVGPGASETMRLCPSPQGVHSRAGGTVIKPIWIIITEP